METEKLVEQASGLAKGAKALANDAEALLAQASQLNLQASSAVRPRTLVNTMKKSLASWGSIPMIWHAYLKMA